MELAFVVEVRGIQCIFPSAHGGGDAAVYGARQGEAAVVVGVLADEVHAARRAGD